MKDIPGYEGLYAVTEDGRVWSYPKNGRHKNGKFIKSYTGKSSNGYANLSLCAGDLKSTVNVHRLVALAYIPNPENKPHINHKNGIRNDNRVENLEWCTAKENVQHGWRDNGRKQTEKQKIHLKQIQNKGKKVMQLTKEGILCKVYDSCREAGIINFLNEDLISCCARGEVKTSGGFIWKYI